MNAFRFVGKLGFGALDSKMPYLRTGKTGKGSDYKSLNFSVAPNKNNRAYVECFGMVTDKIKTMDTSNPAQKKEVAWTDRLDEKVISEVARFRRFSVKLNGKYNEFITEWDFINFVTEHLDELKDKEFVVTGTLSLNVYKGNTSYRFKVQSIREIGTDEEIENGLTVRFDTFYRAKDIVLDNWKKDKEVIINAFTYQYVDNTVQFKYVPVSYYINLANETNEKKAAFFLKQFGIDADEVKTKIKDKEVVSLPVRCDYINGSEEVTFDESCLTDNQREMIEFGLKTLDDFKPNGSIFGQRITKYVCVDADLRGDYANGCKVEEISAGEFESMIYTPETTETNVNDSKDNADIEALFG